MDQGIIVWLDGEILAAYYIKDASKEDKLRDSINGFIKNLPKGTRKAIRITHLDIAKFSGNNKIYKEIK